MAANGMAPPMVTWLDVEAFNTACEHDLSPWEKRCLVKLGNLRAGVLSEETPQPKSPA